MKTKASTKTKIKTVKQLYNFYEAIPENKWCKNEFHREYENGNTKHCAIGHLQANDVDDESLLSKLNVPRGDLIMVNDKEKVGTKKNVLKFLKSFF